MQSKVTWGIIDGQLVPLAIKKKGLTVNSKGAKRRFANGAWHR